MAFTTDVGINVRPLLAVGGVGGIAFGLGAQSFMTSVISGMNLVRLSIPSVSIRFLTMSSIGRRGLIVETSQEPLAALASSLRALNKHASHCLILMTRIDPFAASAGAQRSFPGG